MREDMPVVLAIFAASSFRLFLRFQPALGPSFQRIEAFSLNQ
jgi:hypothetical protein